MQRQQHKPLPVAIGLVGAFGALLIGFGAHAQLMGPMFIPPPLRFDGVGWWMVGIGVVPFFVPLLYALWRDAADRRRRGS